MNAVLCYFALLCQVGFLKHCFPYSISLIHCFWYYVYGFLHLGIKKFQTKCFGDPGIIREFERSFMWERRNSVFECCGMIDQKRGLEMCVNFVMISS